MKYSLHLLSGTAIAACVLFGTNAFAQMMSSTDFSNSKSRIEADYKSGKRSCSSLSGNTRDICIAEIKGKKAVAMAELDHSYKPTTDTQHQIRMAKGEAVYGVSKQKCDDMSGNAKDVCMKEAKAALVAAKADASVEMKTSDANAKASSSNQEVRTEAAAAKRAAELKVAEEKCEALASGAKDNCMNAAKARFGKY